MARLDPAGGIVCLTKLDPSGRIVYSTYLGGTGTDSASAAALDRGGIVHIAGHTQSTDCPRVKALHVKEVMEKESRRAAS